MTTHIRFPGVAGCEIDVQLIGQLYQPTVGFLGCCQLRALQYLR